MSLETVNRVWNDRIGKLVSQSTARRRIHSGSLYKMVAKRKPLIYPNNRRVWIRWCTRAQNCLFKWIEIQSWLYDGRVRVWRENGRALEPENIPGFIRRYPVSLMVCGCVSYRGVGKLFIVNGTMKSIDYIYILDHNLLDSVENIFGDAMIPFIFQTIIH